MQVLPWIFLFSASFQEIHLCVQGRRNQRQKREMWEWHKVQVCLTIMTKGDKLDKNSEESDTCTELQTFLQISYPFS